MEIHRSDAVTSAFGGGHFTGRVHLDALLDEPGDDGMRMYRVVFEPGARTNWHRHPGGQVLFVLAGKARVGVEGSTQLASTGDVVYSAPGEWHWHGADSGGVMMHLAVNPGGKTHWGDDRPVTDEEYGSL